MALLYSLIILVSGFIYCQIHPIIKNKLYRYEGQFLYLKSAQYGFFFLIASVVLLEILEKISYYPNSLCPFTFDKFSILLFVERMLLEHKLVDDKNVKISSYLSTVSTLTIFMPFFINLFERFRLRLKYSTKNFTPYIMSNILKDSPLDYLLFKSSIERGEGSEIFLMLTMADRKVYVGKIVSLGEPSETEGPNQEIEIIPIVSGYREKDTLVVNFTTYYSIVDEDIKLVLKQSEIMSATPFKQSNYDKFHTNDNKSNFLRILLDRIFL